MITNKTSIGPPGDSHSRAPAALTRRELLQRSTVAAGLGAARGLGLLVMSPLSALAVEPGKPSKTSIAAAARRAVATRDPDPTVRNPDTWAARFIGPEERRIIGDDAPLRALDSLDYNEAQRIEPGNVGQHLVRTRYFDDRVRAAVLAGGTQVVILGAGFDSRAYRLPELQTGVTVFEVDYGPTQEYKKNRVRSISGFLPDNVVYVPIDFTVEKIPSVLAKAGFRSNQKTVIVWEGVSYYIPEEAVRETFRFVASLAPGSTIAFDGKWKSFIDWIAANIDNVDGVPEQLRGHLRRHRTFRDWGEPQIFGFPDGRVSEFVASEGLALSEILPEDGPDARRRYLTRKDGSIAWYIAPPAPGEPSGVPFVAEARVPSGRAR